MEPQPRSEKLTLRPELRVRDGYRGEERGGRRQAGDQSSLATKTTSANGSTVAERCGLCKSRGVTGTLVQKCAHLLGEPVP